MHDYARGPSIATIVAAGVGAAAATAATAATAVEPGAGRGETILFAEDGVALERCIEAQRGIIAWLGVDEGLVVPLEDGPTRWATLVAIDDGDDVVLSCGPAGRMEVVRSPLDPR